MGRFSHRGSKKIRARKYFFCFAPCNFPKMALFLGVSIFSEIHARYNTNCDGNEFSKEKDMYCSEGYSQKKVSCFPPGF